MTCPHGITQSECLICRTLAPTAPGQPASNRDVSPAYPVTSPRNRPARRGSFGLQVAGAVAAIALIAVAAWLVVGAAFAILHILEYVLVAVAAGWAGYRIGHFRGSRRPRS